MKTRLAATLTLALLGVLTLVWRPSGAAQAQPDDSRGQRTILARVGVTDTAGRSWSGTLEPESGDAQVTALMGYRFTAEDRIGADGRSFEFSTRPWISGTVDLSPGRPGPRPILANGIYATVRGGDSARFRIQLGEFRHAFPLGELTGGRLVTLAGGNIEIEEAATAEPLDTRAGEADFPSIAAGPAGRAVAWQEFLGERDRLVVREFSGGAWLAPDVFETPETRDVHRTAVAYDGAGTLFVVWSAQVNGDWDLFGLRKTAAGWRSVERLTEAAGPDFHHQLAAGPRGDLWLVWQAFRDTQSDIHLRRFHDERWGPEVKISESRANDWEPSVAVTGEGLAWVVWDSYDQGNYDVFARSYDGARAGAVRPITRSTRFEARASAAADSRGRLWIAFEEAEANWGKDYGYLVKDRGNPLYQTRRLKVVRLTGDRIEEPVRPVADAFPLGAPDFLHAPRIAVSSDGSVVIAALELTHADRVLEVWGVRGVWENLILALDGGGWRRHSVLPSSRGANDVRAAIAAGSSGALWAAWAEDGRLFGAGLPRRQSIRTATLEPVRAGGEIAVKPFEGRPELAPPVHASEADNVRAVRDYLVRSGGKSFRIYRGDLHRHTSLSADGVGDGSLWDFYRYQLDAAQMDMATVTDHQGGATPYNWWKTQKSTDLFLIPGRLVSIYACERSVPYPNGHRNFVFPNRGVPILPITPEERQGKTRSAVAVLPYLRRYNGISFRHTIATNQGTDWADHNNELEPLVEIYQGHRVAYEHEGGPKGATAEKAYLHRSGYQPAGYFWNALAKGYRMGIQASSDHCSTHISYTSVLAEGNTREALIDAMRKRRTYGATDNIVLDFRVQADDKEYLQGEELTTGARYKLTVNVIGAAPIRRIDVIHNERYAYTQTPGGSKSAGFEYEEPKPAAGENRYYVRVEQEDGNLAWSSPVWIRYTGR